MTTAIPVNAEPETSGLGLTDNSSLINGPMNSGSIYAQPPVSSISEAIERMQSITAYASTHEPRRSSDGVACFNQLYTIITKRVLDGIQTGFFADAEFLTQLDVIFANRYFNALRASVASPANVPKSWRVLIESRGDDRIEPIQFAVAGVNAHINFDLSVSVVETCMSLGTELNSGTQRSDYQKINQIFAEEMTSLRRRFENGVERVFDTVFSPVLGVVSNWSVEEARDAAWNVGEHLWKLRQSNIAEEQFVAHVDSLAALAGHLILTPLP